MALSRGFRGGAKYNLESFRDGFWSQGQNETGEIPLWLCLEDSRLQEIFYSLLLCC